jgi:voltage-gated potassium channel
MSDFRSRAKFSIANSSRHIHEGRLLALLLSIYGLAIFGYIAASLATFFIGQDAAAPDCDVAGAREIAALRQDIAALREELRSQS